MYSNQNSKPVILLGNSRSNSNNFKINDKGIKVSTLIQIKKLLCQFGIDIQIATNEGKKLLLDQEREENKEFLKENADLIMKPLNIQQIDSQKYSGIFIPNLVGFYNEFFEDFKQDEGFQQNAIKDIGIQKVLKEFIRDQKPIATVGYGVLPLLLLQSNDGWEFKKHNITCISVAEDSRENTFTNIPFYLEETIREIGANFISSQDIQKQLVVMDHNLITGQNDNSLTQVLKNLCVTIVQEFNI